MKKFLVVLAVLIAFSPSAPVFAKGKKPKPPQKHETVISSVTPTSITITEDKTSKTFTITQFTEINVNGRKATIAELKPGMIVSVILGTDSTRASRINATGK